MFQHEEQVWSKGGQQLQEFWHGAVAHLKVSKCNPKWPGISALPASDTSASHGHYKHMTHKFILSPFLLTYSVVWMSISKSCLEQNFGSCGSIRAMLLHKEKPVLQSYYLIVHIVQKHKQIHRATCAIHDTMYYPSAVWCD